MLKKVCFVALAAMLFLTTMAVPSSVVFGAERTAYSIKDAVSYKGTRNQNMNVYSSFMTAGAGAGAEFSIFVPAEKTYHIIVRASSSAAAGSGIVVCVFKISFTRIPLARARVTEMTRSARRSRLTRIWFI